MCVRCILEGRTGTVPYAPLVVIEKWLHLLREKKQIFSGETVDYFVANHCEKGTLIGILTALESIQAIVANEVDEGGELIIKPGLKIDALCEKIKLETKQVRDTLN